MDIDANRAFEVLSETVAQLARENAILKVQVEVLQEQGKASAFAAFAQGVSNHAEAIDPQGDVEEGSVHSG